MSPIYVALDFSELSPALDLAEKVRDHVEGFKVGLELIWNAGLTAVKAVGDLGLPVFVDAKLHDIPNTVHGAARAIGKLGARFVTVHATGGSDMMLAAVAGLGETAPNGGVLAVTVLTSFDQHAYSSSGFRGQIGEGVAALAAMASEAGAEGVVCAVPDVVSVKSIASGLLTVTPGIRMPEDDTGDQERIATPAAALAAGADVLVVGRPITAAPDPVRAAMLMADRVPGDL